MSTEVYFPRGSSKSAEINGKQRSVKKEKPLFGIKKKSLKKKNRGERDKKRMHGGEAKSDGKTKEANIVDLNYKTLREGMILAGCVRDVQTMQIYVSLPGHMYGRAEIDMISDPYTEQLRALAEERTRREDVVELEKLFRVGELVTVCVNKIAVLHDRSNVMLSLKPSDINRELSAGCLGANSVVVGAVRSKEEHGYMLDLGIESANAFLPTKDVKEFRKGNGHLAIGKIVRVVVKSVKSASGNTTLVVSLNPEAIQSAVPKSGFTAENIMPGNQLNVSVKKVMSNGLVVSPLQTAAPMIGYVTLGHVPNLTGATSGVKLGAVLPATLLYSVPPVNVMYFSLKPQLHHGNRKPHFHDGALVENAKVIATVGNCLYLRLGPKELEAKGFVSPAQIGSGKDFGQGQKCKVRVLRFDFMENVYICSLKDDMVSAKVFSPHDLSVGQTVEAVVTELLKGKGLRLAAGNVELFVPLLHLTDFPNNPSAGCSFKPGSAVTAKVLSKDGSKVIVTLKPTLVSSPALCSYSEAVPGSCYYGTVMRTLDNGVIVWFYNHVSGFIPNAQISSGLDTGLDKSQLYDGQVVRCYVLKASPEEEKLTLSLITQLGSTELNVGASYRLNVVRSGGSEGLQVVIADTSIYGLIPINQLSDHLGLQAVLSESFSPGTEISSATIYRISDATYPYFTLRSSVKNALKENADLCEPENFSKLKEIVVPCTIAKVKDNGINVSVEIPGCAKSHYFVPKSEVLEGKGDLLRLLKENQAVMAVATQIKNDLKLNLKCSLFSDDFKAGVELLEDYLTSVGNGLQTVRCGLRLQAQVVNTLKKDSVQIRLVNKNLKGSIFRSLTGKAFEDNKKLPVVVLWQNPKSKRVMAHPDVEEFSRDKGRVRIKLADASPANAQVVLVCYEFVMGLIKDGPFKGRLTCFPAKRNLNDFVLDKPELMSIINVIPVSFGNGYIISETTQKVKEFVQQTGQTRKQIIRKLMSCSRRKLSVDNNLSDNSEVIMNGSSESLEESVEKTQKKRKISESSVKGIEGKWQIEETECLNGEGDEDQEPKSKKKKKKKSVESEVKSNVHKKKLSLQNGVNTKKIDSAKKRTPMTEPYTSKSEKKLEAPQWNVSTQEERLASSPMDVKSKKRKKSLSESSKESSLSEWNYSEEESSVKKKNKRLADDDSFNNSHADDIKKDQSKGKSKRKSSVGADEKLKTSLQGYGHFSWDVGEKDFTECPEDDEESDNDEAETESAQKGNKRMSASEKRLAAKEAEKRIRETERLLLEAESNPQSVDHFERLTLANPNSSLVWIKYMAVHLEATEIEKARSVARRALQAIGHREEQERLNVWLALLNLENLYGSEESLKKTLADAVQTNDEFRVYSKMAEIYADSNKTKDVEQLTTLMARKFKTETESWLVCCRCLMRAGLLEKARFFFQRALQALPSKSHVQFITRFALLENSLGSPDHAQTVMDHVLTTYPGRLPAWTTYVDMLTKSGRVDLARQVLERSVGQKLPVKKMKTLYKKWLQFEEQHGTESNVNYVRTAAETYVNSLTATIGSV